MSVLSTLGAVGATFAQLLVLGFLFSLD